MSDAIIYNLEGRILRNVSTNIEMMSIQAQVDEFLLLDSLATPDKHYVLDGVVLERPVATTAISKSSITADGVDVITFTDVPNGRFSANRVGLPQYYVAGDINDTDTFSTTIPGTYKIRIESFPYLDFEATIEAT